MMSFLEMSIMGGVMALVITALRAVLLNKLPKRTFVFLWELCLLRLILPLYIPSVTSVYTLLAGIKSAPQGGNITVTEFHAAAEIMPAGEITAAAEITPESAAVSVPVWTVVWLAGAVILFSAFVLGYVLIYRKYRYAVIVKDGYPAEWLAEQKLIRKVRIYRSEQTLSPLTYGIFRPVILLPVGINTEKSEQLDFILTHELTHIKRFDMLRKIIAAAVLCLHWFDPAVWVLFLLYNRDIELACDEAVVRKMKGDCRSAYAMALIGMEERQRGFSSLLSHFSKNAAQERIVAIMNTKNVSAASGAAACAALVGVAGVFGTSAAEPVSPGFGEILIQAADGANETVKIPDTWRDGAFSPLSSINAVVSFMEENGIDPNATPPTHTITAEQRAWLGSRYDLSTMQMSVTEKNGNSYYHHSTKEYCNFIADLVYLNVYSAEEARQLNMTPIPTGGLGLHKADDEPSAWELPLSGNITDAILALIKRDNDLIKYYMEKFNDPLRSEPGDKEFADKLKETLPLKQSFYELLSELSDSGKTYLPETAVPPEVKNKSAQMTEIVDFIENQQ